MGKPSAPDPVATANAQGAANKDAAGYNTALNRVDTYTPYGNSVYTNSGTTENPHYSQTITLSPQTQQQLATQQAQSNQIATAGNALTGQIQNSLNTPLPDTATGADAASHAYYAKQTGFLDPQFANQGEQLDSKLANQGIAQGSEAYNRAQDDFGRQKEFAYGQARDQAIGQGVNYQQGQLANALTVQNQPYNELASLRSGTGIQNPSFQPTYTGGNAQAGDIQGNTYRSYQGQVGAYNNFMSGLFGLGGAATSAAGNAGSFGALFG